MNLPKKPRQKSFRNLDPIGQLTEDGNWFATKEKTNFETLNLLSTATTNVSLISINGGLYQNAGANMVQQIAYSLAHANEYFNRIKNINQPVVFEISVGSNYFFEIAKLRALRLLFNLIAKEYNHNLDCHLLVSPSKRNKTIYDFNVNMAAHHHRMHQVPFWVEPMPLPICPTMLCTTRTTNLATEWPENQLLILKHESCFDKVDNPADGSYYIES